MKFPLLALLALRSPSFEELLRDLSHENAPTRDRASRQLPERWKEWNESGLQKIERAGQGSDAETAVWSRAGAEGYVYRWFRMEKRWK